MSLFIMQLCGSMLPYNRIINNDFSQIQCKLPDDGRRPKHVGAIFMCILM